MRLGRNGALRLTAWRPIMGRAASVLFPRLAGVEFRPRHDLASVPLYAHAEGLSNAEIGALFAAPVLAQVPLNLAGGAYTDRIGGRRIMLGSCWATVVAGVWLMFAQ